MRKRIVSAIVLSIVMGSAALADSVSYLTTTPILVEATDWTKSLSFPKFDPSLGTLTSVTLALSGGIETTIVVKNTGQGDASGTAKTEVYFQVQDAGLQLHSPEFKIGLPADGFDFTPLPPNETKSSGLLAADKSTSDTYTTAGILAEFTGISHNPGVIGLNAATLTHVVLDYFGGNVDASQVTSAELTGSVTYDYRPASIPLPSAAWMGMAILIPMTVRSVRRRLA